MPHREIVAHFYNPAHHGRILGYRDWGGVEIGAPWAQEQRQAVDNPAKPSNEV